jgi:O-antigen/teichoic acid export membrane protein
MRDRLVAVHRSGLPFLLLSLASVQGVTYVSQVLVAKGLPPQEFGSIRSIEAVLATSLVLGGLGMPTLAARYAAETTDDSARGRLLMRLLALAIAASLTAAAVVSLAAPWVFPEPTASNLRALCLVTSVTACSRVVQGYALGAKRIVTVSILTVLLSFVSLPALVVFTWRNNLSGWVTGRYVTEGLLAAVLLLSVRGPLIRAGLAVGVGPSVAVLARLGMPIALSLLLRTGQDAVGLLSLNVLKAAAPLVGHMGLGSLVVAALSVIPGAVASLVLPSMTQKRHVPAESRRFLWRSVSWALWLTAPISLMIGLGGPTALRHLLPAYAEAGPVLQVMALIAPCRAVVAMAGSCLLAHLNVGFGLWTNGMALLGAFGLSLLAGAHYGAMGVAFALLGVEAAVATAYLLAARRVTSDPGSDPASRSRSFKA